MGKAMDALLSCREVIDDCAEKAKYMHGLWNVEPLYQEADEVIERAMRFVALAEFYEERESKEETKKEAEDVEPKHLS